MKKALATSTSPATVEEQALVALLRGQECGADAVRRALEIYTNEYQRETIESLLLAGCSADEVHLALKVPVEVTEVYRKLFFDNSVFEDDLDRMAYATEYKVSKHGNKLKRIAVEAGKDAILVRLSRGAYVVPVDRAHTSLRNLAFEIAQLARLNPADSALAQQAYKWAQMCLHAAENAPDSADKSLIEDIQISIKTADRVTRPNIVKVELDPKDIAR